MAYTDRELLRASQIAYYTVNDTDIANWKEAYDDKKVCFKSGFAVGGGFCAFRVRESKGRGKKPC